jgi:hypothetical protein
MKLSSVVVGAIQQRLGDLINQRDKTKPALAPHYVRLKASQYRQNDRSV